MIAGLLALVMASADTTMRFPSAAADSLSSSTAVTTIISVSDEPPAAAEVAASLVPLLPHVDRRLLEPAWSSRALASPAADTGRKKTGGLVEYSEWYGRRVALHKALSWAMFPLFAVSYYTGDQLAEKGRAGVSGTVRTLHPYAAGGAAAVFGVNTVTGLWNLWDARKDPADRKRRYLHSALFILADAGFAYAGSLGDEAGDNGATRRRHRNIALGSMGASTAGWLIMFLKKD